MDSLILGRTDLRCSRMGLGCGGHSRLGMARGSSEEQAADLVRLALDLGITFIDTAESYRTESAVGLGLRGRRHSAIISTKVGADFEGGLCPPQLFAERVEGCLGRLQTDVIDLMNVHGVTESEYPHAREALYPVLLKLKEQGKIRWIGITEQFIVDTRHVVLQEALKDDLWDVMMVGFSILNPSARHTVFPKTRAQNVGTLGMFAVRRVLNQPEALRELVQKLVDEGQMDPETVDLDDPLGFLGDIRDAAYRLCLHEPGMDIVLSGTGSPEHLRANVQSLTGPPLADSMRARLDAMFGNVDSVSGN